MSTNFVLLADVDVLKLVLVLLPVGIWVLKHLFSSGNDSLAREKPAAQDELERFQQEVNRMRARRSQAAEVVPDSDIQMVDDAAPVQRVRGAHLQDQISRRSSQFAERISQDVSTADVDSKIDQYVHAKFDHQVGQLTKVSLLQESTESLDRNAALTSAADALTEQSELLRLKQAIILREILTRPEHRWASDHDRGRF